MKIKAGDWVKIACLDNTVGKVTQIDERGVHVYIGKLMQNLYTGDFIKCLTKLPIKFKGLNPVFKSIGRVEFWCQRRYLKDIGEVYFDISLNNGRVFVIFGALGKSPISGSVSTIDQSKDWLELQYATMIAKARGLL